MELDEEISNRLIIKIYISAVKLFSAKKCRRADLFTIFWQD